MGKVSSPLSLKRQFTRRYASRQISLSFDKLILTSPFTLTSRWYNNTATWSQHLDSSSPSQTTLRVARIWKDNSFLGIISFGRAPAVSSKPTQWRDKKNFFLKVANRNPLYTLLRWTAMVASVMQQFFSWRKLLPLNSSMNRGVNLFWLGREPSLRLLRFTADLSNEPKGYYTLLFTAPNVQKCCLWNPNLPDGSDGRIWIQSPVQFIQVVVERNPVAIVSKWRIRGGSNGD